MVKPDRNVRYYFLSYFERIFSFNSINKNNKYFVFSFYLKMVIRKGVFVDINKKGLFNYFYFKPKKSLFLKYVKN